MRPRGIQIQQLFGFAKWKTEAFVTTNSYITTTLTQPEGGVNGTNGTDDVVGIHIGDIVYVKTEYGTPIIYNDGNNIFEVYGKLNWDSGSSEHRVTFFYKTLAGVETQITDLTDLDLGTATNFIFRYTMTDQFGNVKPTDIKTAFENFDELQVTAQPSILEEEYFTHGGGNVNTFYITGTTLPTLIGTISDGNKYFIYLNGLKQVNGVDGITISIDGSNNITFTTSSFKLKNGDILSIEYAKSI